MQHLLREGYDPAKFCRTALLLAGENLNDTLEYHLPGFVDLTTLDDGLHGGSSIEAITGETKNFRFAVSVQVSRYTYTSYYPYVVFREEVRGTRPAMGETYRVIEQNTKQRGYERYPYDCVLMIHVMPKATADPQFLRRKALHSFRFCCDGPIEEKTHFNNYQMLHLINPELATPDKPLAVEVAGEQVTACFLGKHAVDLISMYREADAKSLARAKEAVLDIECLGKRVFARIEKGFETGTTLGLHQYLKQEMKTETNPLEKRLLRLAKDALEEGTNEEESYSSNPTGFVPGWGTENRC